MSVEGGVKAVVAAAAANCAIAVTKFGAWALTGASSMLAEAIHSLADTGNQLLLLFGTRDARRAPDAAHPFGHGRSRYLSAFLVGVVLFSVGGVFALIEANAKWTHLREGHPDELLASKWWWTPLVVLGCAIVAESFSLRTALRETRKVIGKANLWRFIRTTKQPELPVVLLEDMAALLGLCFALAGVGATLITGNAVFDVAATALIGALLICVALVVAFETRSLLVGEAADPAQVTAISEALGAVAGVSSVIDLRTLHLGPDDVLVTARVEVPAAASAEAVAATIEDAQTRVRAAAGNVTHCFIEPHITRPIGD